MAYLMTKNGQNTGALAAKQGSVIDQTAPHFLHHGKTAGTLGKGKAVVSNSGVGVPFRKVCPSQSAAGREPGNWGGCLG